MKYEDASEMDLQMILKSLEGLEFNKWDTDFKYRIYDLIHKDYRVVLREGICNKHNNIITLVNGANKFSFEFANKMNFLIDMLCTPKQLLMKKIRKKFYTLVVESDDKMRYNENQEENKKVFEESQTLAKIIG